MLEKLTIPAETMQHIESDIKAAEAELDDDAESIITNERYVYIAQIIKGCYKKKNHGQLSASDKIDKIVTNRWLGLPIFAVVMFLVYWVAMVGVGAPATDWANDGLFGDGWHLFGIGTAEYTEVADNYTAAMDAVSGYYELDTEAENFDADAALADMKAVQPDADSATIEVEDEETLAQNEMTVYYDAIPEDADEESTVGMTYVDAVSYLEENGFDEPDPADYGVAQRPDSGRYRRRCRRGARLRAADARAVPDARLPRGLRLHGPYCLRARPYLPQVRPVR